MECDFVVFEIKRVSTFRKRDQRSQVKDYCEDDDFDIEQIYSFQESNP